MNTMVTLDKLFDSIGECLTVDVANRLLKLTLPDSLQQQLDDWADRNLEGKLSDDERGQYEAVLRALNFLAVLQGKARRMIASSPP